MAKTYIDTVKYLIKANFEIDGLVEKPDIVGAVFGQTEGLLGDELDLRELQKNGRIGRIEVESQARAGKSLGTIIIPSSLDMVETSILAASLEVVDRVGPCEARIAVAKIEDSRNTKRKQVLDRAQHLLKTMLVEELPESKELSEMVREQLKTAEIVTYGEDKLPAGPGVESSDAIIVVEGRADVLNLLKNSVTNAVAVGGARVGETIIKLCRQKEVTVFLDGDRGGDIILKELVSATDIDFVARAPNGLEVEDLSRKELIKALRRRIPLEQVVGYENTQKEDRGEDRRERKFDRNAPAQRHQTHHDSPKVERPEPRVERPMREPVKEPVPVKEAAPAMDVDPAKSAELKSILKELEGSLKARLINEDGSVRSEVPIREIMRSLSEQENIHAVVLDGIVTQRLVDLAGQKKAKYVVGIRSGNVSRAPPGLGIILAEN
ncbi:DNA primase [Candidatus Micrarchaeota archaeon]|nr:DNA primase [Candidatus Micrarchaeota archaeon]